MRILKFLISLAITLGLIYFLDNRWTINGIALPAVGRFVDPFHGFWQNLESKTPATPEPLSIPGLQGTVTVAFDSIGVPHITATSDEDLYFAQGYLTARDRLWQMEFQTHAAAGRISEIIGVGPDSAILNYDRGQRRLGMVYAAQHALDAILNLPSTAKVVQRYAAGINAYIESLDYKHLPFEYKLLHYKPEPWTPLKCALLLKSMAQTLNMRDNDMEVTNALKVYGYDVVQLLYPDREPIGDPIVDRTGQWAFKPIKLDTVPMAVPSELINIKRLPKADPTTGSNNWAVSGSKTFTGSPILCGDPHLNLSLPSIWYAVQLQAPGVNTMGASLPGAPGVIIGCNDSIAWSVTNAQRDLVDWFQITFQDKSRNAYQLDGKWVKTTKVIEKFAVRDHPVFYDTVVYTHWGPITYDESFHAESQKKHYAFRWISHDKSNEFLAFMMLNRAHNHQQYLEALDHFESPAQNFVFASVSGDIAMRVQGKYPVRRSPEGKFVLDGSKSSNGWAAFIPPRENVMDKNPTRGFVSSANQYPADASYPYYITASEYEAYRNRRINHVLTGLNAITPADMMRLQNDNYNLKAAESLPYFLTTLDSTKLSAAEKEAYDVLKKWNYVNDTASLGASYYEAWWDNLEPSLWSTLTAQNMETPTTFNTIRLLKEKPDLDFFDDKSTAAVETAPARIRQAFTKGVATIQKWKSEHGNNPAAWADYKGSYLNHLMRLEPFRVNLHTGGNHDIVNAHSRTHGPSWRMIVSLEKSGVAMWAAYPGGQSGNPGGTHYLDQVDRWEHGRYFAIPFLREKQNNASGIVTLLQLNPVNPEKP